MGFRMNYLVCEPSFVGFLSAVYDAYYEKKDGAAITADPNACTLADEYTHTAEDVEKAKKVRAGVIKKGGAQAYTLISDAYRSGNPDKENIIFDYLKLFFKYGNTVAERYDNPAVVAFNGLTNKVWHEIHRVSAFVRLQEMTNGVFYGFYSSDNDILEKLMPVITPRFNTMRFVLHDYKRGKMAYYDGETVRYSVAPEQVEIELSQSELFFQNIWKQYHENVSIKERKNYRQQRAFAPIKYRHFMLEF